MSPRASADATHRGRAWSGIVFAVLFFVGLLPLGELLGSFGDPDATFVAFFERDSNRVGTLVGSFVLALAGVTFLWFLSHLRLSTTGPGPLPGVVSAAGTAFVALLFASAAFTGHGSLRQDLRRCVR